MILDLKLPTDREASVPVLHRSGQKLTTKICQSRSFLHLNSRKVPTEVFFHLIRNFRTFDRLQNSLQRLSMEQFKARNNPPFQHFWHL